MTNLTDGLSPQALHTYQQAFQFFVTWGVDVESAHQQAMLIALDGTGPEAVGPDVFGPHPSPAVVGIAHPAPPRRPPQPPHH